LSESRNGHAAPIPLGTRELRFVSDLAPGIRRRRAGGHFSYVGPDGAVIRDPEELRRIRAIVIPPAWTDVWICPDPRGHMQATGRDSKGRKVYKYHPRFREVRDQAKYERLIAFAKALPGIRRRIWADIRHRNHTRERVLAVVVELLDLTHIRVGNEEYARANGSYGLTTLRRKHAKVNGSTIRFTYRGKSGKDHTIGVCNRRLARVVRRCQELPGQLLFKYVGEDGQVHHVESGDVNDYLREISGQDITAKDFRTWAGTVIAATALCAHPTCESDAERKRNITAAIDETAARLNNTRAVCRGSYVHPAVLESYEQGITIEDFHPRTSASANALTSIERRVLALLRRAITEKKRQPRSRARQAA
jgi:DNA topoisomerase I